MSAAANLDPYEGDELCSFPDGPDYLAMHRGRRVRVVRDRLYRGYRISLEKPPIPTRRFDWSFVHEDYDLGDDRHGNAASVAECIEAINEKEDER